MKIIILGPQGSGKGTQAALLHERFSIPIIATGDIFRAEVQRKGALGQKIEKLMVAGKLIPDTITNAIIKRKLLTAEIQKTGAILDGYPRTLAQAKVLQKYWKLDHVIFLDVPREELLKRLRDRLVCVGCRFIFHKKYKPSKLEDLCDACGGHLEKRKDDNPKTIRERLRIYKNETYPVILFYKKLGLVRRIHGARTIEGVWKEVEKAIANAQL